MKKATKILIAAFAVVSLLLVFTTASFAYSEDADSVTEEPDGITASVTEEESDSEKNFFEELFRAFEENVSEILSALAFIGSLIIMLAYKKGLLPIVNDGLKAIKSGIKAINERAESFNEHAIAVCDGIDERLKRAENLSEAVLKSAESVEEELGEIKSASAENEKLKTVLNAQIDMLYEIFMSAALPQYLKDNVGEKIGKMRAALGKEAENDKLV